MAQLARNPSLLHRLPIRLTDTSLASPSMWSSRPYRYTQSPVKLFFEDAATFGNVLWTILDAIRPTNAKDDGDVELFNTWRGRRDNFLTTFVSILQALMAPTAVFGMLLLPGLLGALLVGSMVFFTWIILLPVQGPRLVESKVDLSGESASPNSSNPREKWIFINGIMVHHIGLQSAVDAIARVFKRPVLGIHNETSGFFGDILECLMQRCFAYSTLDVRFAYQVMFNHITNPDIDKIVLVAHSQGGIIASLVVDRLFDELPQEIVGKLEVYTFGSAASHFNDPSHRRHLYQGGNGTEAAQRAKIPATFTGSPEASDSSASSTPPHHNGNLEESTSASSVSEACPDHVVLTIEHYANEHDPIPRWGVLHAFKALFDTRYSGKLFVRRGASGHFFTSHYLAAWFPLDAKTADTVKNQDVTVQGLPAQDRVESETNIPRSQTYDSMLEEATHMKWGNDQPATNVDLERMEDARQRLGEGQFYVLGDTPRYSKKMQRVSRLWQYVDGSSPI